MNIEWLRLFVIRKLALFVFFFSKRNQEKRAANIQIYISNFEHHAYFVYFFFFVSRENQIQNKSLTPVQTKFISLLMCQPVSLLGCTNKTSKLLTFMQTIRCLTVLTVTGTKWKIFHSMPISICLFYSRMNQSNVYPIWLSGQSMLCLSFGNLLLTGPMSRFLDAWTNKIYVYLFDIRAYQTDVYNL